MPRSGEKFSEVFTVGVCILTVAKTIFTAVRPTVWRGAKHSLKTFGGAMAPLDPPLKGALRVQSTSEGALPNVSEGALRYISEGALSNSSRDTLCETGGAPASHSAHNAFGGI